MITTTGLVIKSTGSWYSVIDQEKVSYQCRVKGKLRIKDIKSTNPISVGDWVEFEIEPDIIHTINSRRGVIIGIKERKNYIIRKSINLSKEVHIIASNIDQALLVITLKKPLTTTTFIDRFLASTEAYTIPTILVFNKFDLYNEEETVFLEKLISIYQIIGYRCLTTSIHTGQGFAELKQIMANKINVISGHSGVGKSSIINKLDPLLQLKTGTISDYHEQGKHITTFSEMFALGFGGYIIDTPGIRGFGIIDMHKKEIYHFFKEIFTISDQCRFYNCTHVHEPGCAVIDAVKKGSIALSRYESYLNILGDDEERYRNS
jgi:ribosome biogenesis GTPase / thiamine phosphate phosphatase